MRSRSTGSSDVSSFKNALSASISPGQKEPKVIDRHDENAAEQEKIKPALALVQPGDLLGSAEGDPLPQPPPPVVEVAHLDEQNDPVGARCERQDHGVLAGHTGLRVFPGRSDRGHFNPIHVQSIGGRNLQDFQPEMNPGGGQAHRQAIGGVAAAVEFGIVQAVAVPEPGNVDESGRAGRGGRIEIGGAQVLVPVKFILAAQFGRPAAIEIPLGQVQDTLHRHGRL